MNVTQLDLTDEQRHWLKRLVQSRAQSAAEPPAVPEHVVDALAEKHLLHFRRGAIELTFVGLAEMCCRQT